VDFNQYKLTNPEIFALDKDIQKLRWSHINQLRERYIKKITEVKLICKKIFIGTKKNNSHGKFRKRI
jgi:hypothetical protein